MNNRIKLLIFAIIFSAATAYGTDEFQISRPQGLCYDSQGKLYVADAGNHRILITAVCG